MDMPSASNQYAFSVAFNAEGFGYNVNEWNAICQDILIAITTSHLPSLSGDRWEDYGEGRIFWGTKAECDAVKAVLEDFDVNIEEERNLESGFYGTDTETYYVAESGHIDCLHKSSVAASDTSSRAVDCIPLKAYRLREASLGQTLSSKDP